MKYVELKDKLCNYISKLKIEKARDLIDEAISKDEFITDTFIIDRLRKLYLILASPESNTDNLDCIGVDRSLAYHNLPHSYIKMLSNFKYEDIYQSDYYSNDDCFPEQFITDLDKNYDVISFDFFDTLIYRLSDDPTRIFIEVGNRLKSKGIIKDHHITPMDFLSLRRAAEERARKYSLKLRGSYECSIEEIYRHLRFIVENVEEGVRTELEVEQDFCFLNPSIATLVVFCKKKGKKVVILSDTYFSSRQILSILYWNGFPLENIDLTLTSSEVGISKSAGGLFDIAMRKLRAKPQNWFHIGDNELADVKGALKVGIKSIYYARRNEFADQVFIAEENIKYSTNKVASLNAFRLLTAKMRNNIPSDMHSAFIIGALIWGPVLSRFIDWSITQCYKENIRKVLVFMREAHTFLPMFKNAVNAYNIDIEAYPFFVSRHSVNLASLFKVTPQVLFEKTHKRRTTTPRRILEALELPYKSIPEIPKDLMDVELNDQERMSLCKILATNPDYRNCLMQIAQDRRNKFVSYIKSFIRGEKKVGVLDLGFGGTIQERIESIIKYERIHCKLVGLYFATNFAAAYKVLKGIDIRSFLGSLGGWGSLLMVFTKHPEILEQSVSAPFGTTLGYYEDNNKNILPIVEDIGIQPDNVRKRYFIVKGIFEFHKIWLPFIVSRIKKGRFADDVWLKDIDDQCISIICRIFGFPFKEEAECLGSLYHDDNDGTTTGDYICSDDVRNTYKEGGLVEMLKTRPYWPQGVIGWEDPDLIKQLINSFRILLSL